MSGGDVRGPLDEGPTVPAITIAGYASLDSAVELKSFQGTEATSVLRGPIVADSPGVGGVAHLARAVVGAGVSARVVTWLGDDAAGRHWRARVAADGVDVSGVAVSGSRSPAATLLYVADGATICLFDPGDCHRSALDDRQRAVLAASDAVILTVADRSHTSALLDALPEGVLLAWAVKNDADAYTSELVDRVLTRADIVSFSRGERPFLSADGVGPERRVRPGTLLIETRGQHGAAWCLAGVDAEHDIRGAEPVQPVVGVDTTGAGDTLIASVVARRAIGLRRVPRASATPTPPELIRDLVRAAVDDVATMLHARASAHRHSTTPEPLTPPTPTPEHSEGDQR